MIRSRRRFRRARQNARARTLPNIPGWRILHRADITSACQRQFHLERRLIFFVDAAGNERMCIEEGYTHAHDRRQTFFDLQLVRSFHRDNIPTLFFEAAQAMQLNPEALRNLILQHRPKAAS